MSEHRSLVRSASLITGITLLSRVFGYLRDQRIAFLLGAGLEADAYTIAYRIPNLLRRLVGEGAVSAAFIPVFSKYLAKENRQEAWEFANAMLTIITLIMAAVTVIGILASPLLVLAISYGFTQTPGKVELAAGLARLMFPYIFLISLSALAMGVLNSLHKFAAPAAAPVLLNLSIIAFSFLSGAFSTPERALAAGVVVGGVLQLAIQVPQLVRSGWRFRPRLNLAHPDVRRTARLMGPVIVGAGVAQINLIVDGQFASFLGNGPQMALYLSDRVMELVLGGYSIAIATVVLPMLSRNAAQSNTGQMLSTLNFACRMILFITIPSTIGLIVLRVPIIRVLFEHGEFNADSTALTAFPLLFFAFGLSAFSLVKVVVSAFYSIEDTRTPVKVAIGAMLLNIVLNFAFFRPLQVGGPALATATAGIFNALTLVVLFSRRNGSIGLRSILKSLGRFLVGALALGGVAAVLINRPGFYDDQPFVQQAVALSVTIAASAAIYFAVAYVLRCPELGEIREVFRRRRSESA